MDNRLYEGKLANHKIFKDIEDSLKENSSGKLRNLIELKDDVLYVWNNVENCLLCLNLKHFEEHDGKTPYQKLHLLSPPAFSVERIMTSTCGSRICVWGSRGVVVMELPLRWGRGGLFDSGNHTILCKSYSLDERFLYSQVEVRRVNWHPSSLSHLLVLVSDNTIRLYNIALKSGPKLAKMYSIGPKPSGLLAGRTILDSLGDTAVDFTATPDSDSILILRGNGDVYMMQCNLETGSGLQHKLTGPLAMYPPADDNYGSESCSIVSLGGGEVPPLIVVATCSGALYHCLLLPNATDNEDVDPYALYVVEAVELNIVLNPDDDIDLQYSYPMHLYPCTKSSYVCLHAGGVHTVSLPILGHLKDYALANEVDTDTILSAICSKPSVARHLVCTSGPGLKLTPPVGLAVTAPPLPGLMVLCADCSLLYRTLEPLDLEEQLYKELQLRNPALEQDDINNLLKERQKLTFTAIIQEILTREVSQPILNINKNEEPSPKECLELVTQATLNLRNQYMSRQQRALDALSRKLVALQALNKQQDRWRNELQKDIDDVQLQSAVLKEKCALAEKYQDDMKYRCSTIVRALRSTCASLNSSERALASDLESLKQRAERLDDHIRMLRTYSNRKSDELKKLQEEYKRKDVVLGKSHSDTISSILQQQTNQISSLVDETKLFKDKLSIV